MLVSSTFYLSAVINLNDANPTANFSRHQVDPHNPTHAHPLIQSDVSSGNDQVEHVRRLPRHPLVGFLEIVSRSIRKGKLGDIVGEGEGCGSWGGDDVENFWRVGNLERNVRIAVGLDQEFHRIDHCNAHSTYAPWGIIPSE